MHKRLGIWIAILMVVPSYGSETSLFTRTVDNEETNEQSTQGSSSASSIQGLIGGYTGGSKENTTGYASHVLNGPSLSPLSTTNTAKTGVVAMNASGIGLIGGETGSSPKIPYAAWVDPAGTLTPLLDVVNEGAILGVAINATSTGLIGGYFYLGMTQTQYTALITGNTVTSLLNTNPQGGIYTVGINDQGYGVIGGILNAGDPYAGVVDHLGTVSPVSNFSISTGQIRSCAINSSNKILIGGTGDFSTPYVGFVNASTYQVTPYEFPDASAGTINSVALNSTGKGLVGGTIDTELLFNQAYVGFVQENGSATVTNLGLSFDGVILGVAINDSGLGLLGGQNTISHSAYAAHISNDNVVTALDLNLPTGSLIASVSLNNTGAGLIGGTYDDTTGYAALVAPNGTVTPLNPSPSTYITDVAIIPLSSQSVNTVVPRWAGSGTFPPVAALQTTIAASIAKVREQIASQIAGTLKKARNQKPVMRVQNGISFLECANNALPLNQRFPNATQSIQDSFWLTPFGDFFRTSTEGPLPECINKVGGILMGYDHREEHYLIGTTLSYAFNAMNYPHSRNHGFLQQQLASLFWAYYQKYFWFDLALWAGPYQLHNTRHTLSIITTKTSTHGWLLSPHLVIAFPFPFAEGSPNYAEPFFQFDWINSWQSHYTEHGASGFNLVMPALYATLLQSEIGVRFYELYQYRWGHIFLEEKLSYVNLAPFRVHNVSTHFVASPSSFLVAVGSNTVRNLVGVEFDCFFVPDNEPYPFGGLVLWGLLGPHFQSGSFNITIGKDF